MLDALLGSIRQMSVFMICAQALIHFKPKGSYEKYLKLLVGAMILVQLLGPIQALLSGGGQSLEERIAFYSSSFEQGLGEEALEEYRVEQIRRQLLTSQIQTQMENWDIGTGNEAGEIDVPGQSTGSGAGETEGLGQGTDGAGGETGFSGPGTDGDEREADASGQGTVEEVRVQIDPVVVELP